MSQTNLSLIVKDGNSRCSGSHIILTANSASSIPEDEYIFFKAVFKDEDGNDIERTIKDSNGDVVKIEEIDSLVVLEYNFITIKPIYYGDNKPSDLKVYQF